MKTYLKEDIGIQPNIPTFVVAPITTNPQSIDYSDLLHVNGKSVGNGCARFYDDKLINRFGFDEFYLVDVPKKCIGTIKYSNGSVSPSLDYDGIANVIVKGVDEPCIGIFWNEYMESDSGKKPVVFRIQRGKVYLRSTYDEDNKRRLKENKKQTMKITESQLRQMIKKSVKRVLKEEYSPDYTTEDILGFIPSWSTEQILDFYRGSDYRLMDDVEYFQLDQPRIWDALQQELIKRGYDPKTCRFTDDNMESDMRDKLEQRRLERVAEYEKQNKIKTLNMLKRIPQNNGVLK